MSNAPLVNIGELAKPATVLIERISDAVGGLCNPWQIKRVAKAEADAAITQAESQIEVTDLHRRAAARWLEEEAQKQSNMEAITAKAIPLLEEKAQPEKMDKDWITNFFDKSRLVSDEEMQNMWSKILSGEANSPGAFSKRTVNFLSGLDKSDAELFTMLCRFSWTVNRTNAYPLIYSHDSVIYQMHNLTFAALTHLDSIGLIKLYVASTEAALTKILKRLELSYFSETTIIDLPNNAFKLGEAAFTKIGSELFPICDAQPVAGFHDFIIKEWQAFGYAIVRHRSASK